MKKYLKLIALFLWMSVIFYFSAEPQLESEAASNLATDILYHIYHFVFSAGMDSDVFFARYGQFIRKLAHFTEFAILGILAKSVYEDRWNKNTILYPVLFCALYAVSDEVHQYFVPGRYCALKDMCIDTAGALTGVLFYHLCENRWKRKKGS